MKALSQITMIFVLGLSLAVFGCGGEDTPKDQTGTGDNTGATDGGDTTSTDNTDTSGGDTSGGDTSGGDTSTGDITAECTQVCEYLLSCLGQLVCDPALGELDAAGCVQNCVARGEMDQASAANYVTQSCDDINRAQCNAEPEEFANCNCPQAAQGNCPEGLFCTIPLTDQNGNTLYACGDEAGAAPAEADSCSQTEPACTDTTQQCILFGAGGAEGSCLSLCEQ